MGRIFGPDKGPGRTWFREFAQAPATLLYDSFVRVYFSCRPPPDANGQYVSHSAWVDLDRSDVTRVIRVAEQPILPLGGVGAFDEFGIYPVSPVRRGERVWAYYGGWTRCESVPFNVAIGVAVSDDGGATFSRLGTGPVLGYTPDEPFVLSGPKVREFGGVLHLFYIAGRKWKVVDGRAEPVYKIRMATSTDGISWNRVDRDLIPSRVEEDEAQASPDVFYANGAYHMFFCYRYSSRYRGKQFGYRIGYASSLDLIEWVRDDARAGIDVASQGWDSEMQSYPHVFAMDGQTYLMYLGNGVGRDGFGIARLEGSLE
jgi:hypothetical protein